MANTDDRYYDKGDKVRLHCTCTSSGSLTDPTTVTLKLKDPDETETIYTYANGDVVRGSQGYFYYDHVIPTSITHGAWHYRFEVTGPVTGGAEKTFIVNPSHFD